MRGIATAALALALPTAALLGGGHMMSLVAPRSETSRVPLMKRWGYTKAEAAAFWHDLGDGLVAERRFLEIDLLFPFVYGGALLASLLLLWAGLGRPFSPLWLVVPVIVAAVADWTENLVHLQQSSAFCRGGEAAVGGAWIALASAATIGKLLFLILAGLELLALVGVLVVTALRADS